MVWLTNYLCAETKLVGPVTTQLREIGAVTAISATCIGPKAWDAALVGAMLGRLVWLTHHLRERDLPTERRDQVVGLVTNQRARHYDIV